MNNNIIYGLIDPRTGELKYIGKSQHGITRFKQHLKPYSLKKHNHKNNWIKLLLSLGLMPEFIILETLSNPNDLFQAEEFWYEYYLGLGCNLTNSTKCGQGTNGYHHREETVNVLREKALNRDKSIYKIPHNKKFNVVIDGKEHRECASCKDLKEIHHFSTSHKGKSYQSYCKYCNAISQKEWKLINPSPILSEEDYKKSRAPGYTAGGEASKRPERRAQAAEQRSKAIIATHVETGNVLEFPSALKAKDAGFQNSNIGQAIKFNKPYRNYNWKFAA